jgi:structure-specific recognition protein 1
MTTHQQLEFQKISLGGRSATVFGDLTISDSEKAFSWKSSTSGGQVSVRKDKIKQLDWLFTTRGYQLRVWKDGDGVVDFVGFEEEDFERINSFIISHLSETGVTLNTINANASGINWGTPKFRGNYMIFKDGDKENFTIALSDVKNTQKISKNNELILEFHDDDTASRVDDCLVEMRLVVPNVSIDDTGDDTGAVSLDGIHKMILEKAEISTDTGEAIASFPNMQFVTPRGTYNVDLYRKFLRLHGKTYAFKIMYKSISTLFLLPKPGGTHMYFVISLDTPIRQGQKPYYHLVFNFNKTSAFKEDEPLTLQMDKKEIDEKYKGKNLKKKMDGPLYEVVAKVFRALTDRKLIGAGKFNSYAGDKGIKCSLKANEGFLFFLEKSIFFLHKPAIYMRHEEIKSFKFQRADNRAGGSRYFDLAVALKSGKGHVFSNINKDEYDNLVEFISNKGLVIDNIIQTKQTPDYTTFGDDDDSDEDDADFQAEPTNEEDDDADFDEYTTQTQAKDEVQEGEEEDGVAAAAKPSDGSSKKRKTSPANGEEENASKKKKE